MNKQFQAHTTQHAFVLSLSKPMIEALRYLAIEHKQYADHIPMFTSVDSLRRRGLVSGLPPRLTEEGEMVLELCRRAGLVSQLQAVAA